MKNTLHLFGIILALNLYGIAPVFASNNEDESIKDTDSKEEIVHIGTVAPGDEDDPNIWESQAKDINN